MVTQSSSTYNTIPEYVIAEALRALTGPDDAAAAAAAQTDCGLWNHVRDALAAARAQDGQRAAQRALAALQRQYPDLIALLASAPPNGQPKPKRTRNRASNAGAPATPTANTQAPSPSAWLIEYAKQHAEFYHTLDGDKYALATINGIRQTIPLAERGGGLRAWLSRAYYEAHGAPPSRAALDGALDVLAAYAKYDGQCQQVWLRIAYDADANRLYIDLADERWRAIEIDAAGWRIVDTPPVVFRRGQGMKALPEPQPGGSLQELRDAFKLGVTDTDWVLLCGWLLGTVQPPGPGAIPALALQAEPGSGKTLLAQVLRRIVDDHEAVHGSTPRNEEDIVIEARHAHIITLDNLTRIDQAMSDLLCRMATGGAFVKRRLYTDDDASYIKFKRPVILTSIADIVTAGDLLDRTIIIRLNRIVQYSSESELDRIFQRLHPRLLGALCDAISAGLRNYNATPTPNVRMADLARWVEACAPALGWQPGTFTEALRTQRAESARLALESDPLTQEIERLLSKKTEWEGTPEDLYQQMEHALLSTYGRAPRWWPVDAARLMQRLQKLAADLRRIGIEVTPPHQRRMPDGTRKRVLRLTRVQAPSVNPTPATGPANPSAPSAPPPPPPSAGPAVTPVTPLDWEGVTAPPHSDAENTPVTPVTPNFSQLYVNGQAPPSEHGIPTRQPAPVKEWQGAVAMAIHADLKRDWPEYTSSAGGGCVDIVKRGVWQSVARVRYDDYPNVADAAAALLGQLRAMRQQPQGG